MYLVNMRKQKHSLNLQAMSRTGMAYTKSQRRIYWRDNKLHNPIVSEFPVNSSDPFHMMYTDQTHSYQMYRLDTHMHCHSSNQLPRVDFQDTEHKHRFSYTCLWDTWQSTRSQKRVL